MVRDKQQTNVHITECKIPTTPNIMNRKDKSLPIYRTGKPPVVCESEKMED